MPAGDGSSSARTRGGVRGDDECEDEGGRSAARLASAAGDAGTVLAGDKTRDASIDFRADLRGETYKVLRDS